MNGADAVCALQAAGFSVSIRNGKVNVTGGGAKPHDLVEAVKADKRGAIEYLRSIQRREDTISSFQRFFERQHDPAAGRQFWHETHRRDDDDGDGRVG